MEEFARLVVQSNSLDIIASVHDQYLDFVCVEKNLFHISNKADSYIAMNGRGVTDQVMEKYMEEIAYGLFSVVGTFGSIPVIRCPKVRLPNISRFHVIGQIYTQSMICFMSMKLKSAGRRTRNGCS